MNYLTDGGMRGKGFCCDRGDTDQRESKSRHALLHHNHTWPPSCITRGYMRLFKNIRFASFLGVTAG